MLRPEQLFEHIPRKIVDWEPVDVEKWFAVNNIQTSTHFSFVKERFNGRALLKVTPDYLLNTCGVTSRIVMKKIFEWLEYDKEDFEEYVEEHGGSFSPQLETQIVSEEPILEKIEDEPTQRPASQKNEIFIQCLPTEKEQSVSPRNICGQHQKHSEGIKPLQVQKWKKKGGSQSSIALQKVHSSKENSRKLSNKSQKSILIGANFVKSSYEYHQRIIEFRFEKKTYFLINSGKIGRMTSNDIIANSESVSRLHAQIIKEGTEFWLKDVGSRFGTFVPVRTGNRRILLEGDIVSFDDHLFEVFKYKFYSSNGTFDLRLRSCSLNEKQTISSFYGRKQVSIGRSGKDIVLNESTIHPNHARFTFNQSGELIIEEQQGQCYRKLKEDELVRLQQSDLSLKLGLLIVEIRIITTRKSVPSISEFDYFK